jgi:hypothetical protein
MPDDMDGRCGWRNLRTGEESVVIYFKDLSCVFVVVDGVYIGERIY